MWNQEEVARQIKNLTIQDWYAVYPYGSRVYGTEQEGSDWDFIAISNDADNGEMERDGLINLKVMSPEHFQSLLDRHNISALECLFLPRDSILVEPPRDWEWNLSLSSLRTSISKKSNNSWVKAKKKMVAPYDWAEGENLRGRKSLFHSFRILMFGIQIASEGKIYDYSEANEIFEDIITDPSNDWQHYYDKWKAKHNSLATEFRKLAPKA